MARPARTTGEDGRSLDSGRRDSGARLEVPFMHQRPDIQGQKSKMGRFRRAFDLRRFDFGRWTLGLGLVPSCLILLLVMVVLAVTGCDLFDPGKTDDPVFGPPPPRAKTAAIQPITSQTAENAAAAPASAAGSPGESAGALQASSATTRGLAPSEETIKQASFTGHGPQASKKLSGNEVAAMVNGQPIFASEIFERAYPEPLPPEGLSLLVAGKNLATGRVTEQELRALQETAIKKYLKDYIRTRVLAQAIEAKMEKEQKDKIEEAIGKMFDEYVEKLKKDLKAAARHEVDKKLHEQGTSLASLKVEFRYRLLADEYVRQKSKKPHVVGRQEILAYYEAHASDYSYPEKVRWQLLEISFAKHGGQAKALGVLEKAVDELRRGENFGKVAKKYSDGPGAENGGQQSWMKPDSVADEKTCAMLHKLAQGEVSTVVHAADSYRLIRLSARKPAGRSTLAEVQESIRQKIEERLQKEATREVLVDVYQHASIESPFLSPEELGPPADVAGIPTPAKTGNDSSKKRRDRS
jgi:parvulin-like peptidyl-prolyl isomerase